MTDARMTRDEVLALAKFSKETLARKRKADPAWLPAAAVQGGRQMIFDRDAVLKALGVKQDAQPDTNTRDPWDINPDALKAALSRKVRHRTSAVAPAAAGRRVAPGVLSGPRAPVPLRLAASNPARARP